MPVLNIVDPLAGQELPTVDLIPVVRLPADVSIRGVEISAGSPAPVIEITGGAPVGILSASVGEPAGSLVASGGISLTGGGSAGNITLSGGGSLTTSGSVTLAAGGNLTLTAGGNFTLAGGGTLTTNGGISVSGTGLSVPSPILGTRLADLLQGSSGDDELDGGRGADRMAGGAGNDRYQVDHRGDLCEESADGGLDEVLSSVSYRLPEHVEILRLDGRGNLRGTGNDGDNLLYGNAGRNRLDGGAGDDALDGGAGADMLRGGAGDDVFHIDHRGDRVAERAGEGTDSVFASISYRLGGNVENLSLTGEARDARGNGLDNLLQGNDADNRLWGFGGDDSLAGGAGDDTLDGGAGRDVLLGGDGDDLILFDAADLSVDGGAGTDTLRAGRAGTLDLDAVAVTGIEVIDMSDRGAHVLHLGDEALARLQGDAGVTLVVHGDRHDAVDAGFGWTDHGVLSDGPQAGYHQFARGGVLLLVDGDVDMSGIRATPPVITGIEMSLPVLPEIELIPFDPIVMPEPIFIGLPEITVADGTWTGSPGDDLFVFDRPPAMVDGRDGMDTLMLAGSGALLELSQVRNIERIDLAGSGDNALWVTAGALAANGGPLRVDGDAGDVVRLMGEGWSAPGGAPEGYTLFAAGSATLLANSALDLVFG